MFLGKKGVVEMSLGELIKTVLSLIVLGAMSVFFYTVILSPILNPPEKKDFEKIYEELIALEEGENIPVFLKSTNKYTLSLYKHGNQEEPKCKKQMCLCYEAGATKDCKILPKEFAECGVRGKVCLEKQGLIEMNGEKQLLLSMDENNNPNICTEKAYCVIKT